MKNLTQCIIAALILIPLITCLRYQQVQAEDQASKRFVNELNSEMDRRDTELQPLIERNKKLAVNPNTLK